MAEMEKCLWIFVHPSNTSQAKDKLKKTATTAHALRYIAVGSALHVKMRCQEKDVWMGWIQRKMRKHKIRSENISAAPCFLNARKLFKMVWSCL